MTFNEMFPLEKEVGSYILVGQLGSKVYGTDTPESDDDFVGIVVPPLSYYFGLKQWPDTDTFKVNKKKEYNAELQGFEIKKFLRLCLNFNPNAIPFLYLDDSDYIFQNSCGRLLIKNRHAFTSKRAYTTMIGYAKSQLKSVVNGDTGKLGAKRKELVTKYGYDVKYAAHTIRILHMALEFFKDGKLNVKRTWDLDQLMSIRTGSWHLGEWLAEVKFLISLAEIEEKKNNLLEKPDFELVDELCIQIIDWMTNHTLQVRTGDILL